jgi:cyclase
MLRPRIIPCLLLSRGGLVKTVRFRDPRYVGDPINAVKIFNEKEADELIVLDIDATTEGRDPDERLISQFAAECRMPLCFGGGIRTVEQARRIIGLGVEKIAISAAALARPELIGTVAREIGSQSVVVVLDARKSPRSDKYEVYTHNGTRATGLDPAAAALAATDEGAGEILVNAIDQDGVMAGYDIELATIVRQATRLPITVLGGAGSLADMGTLIRRCGVLGAAAGSLFVFKGAYRAVLINYPDSKQKEDVFRASLNLSSPIHEPI